MSQRETETMPGREDDSPVMVYDKGELRERLTPTQYQVTQEHHTEKQFTNKYYKHNARGIYSCIVCGTDHFNSNTKYDSGSGWPSFWDVMDKTRIRTRADASAVGGNLLRIISNPGLIRTEVSCKMCGSHIGHVFKDGPKPTGLRYCVNSASLHFTPAPDGHDSVDGGESATTAGADLILISHPATLGGCGGSDGACTRPPRPVKKLSPPPQFTKDTAANSQAVAAPGLIYHPATLGGCGGSDGACTRPIAAAKKFSPPPPPPPPSQSSESSAAPLPYHPATLGGCGGVEGVCQRVSQLSVLSPARSPEPSI